MELVNGEQGSLVGELSKGIELTKQLKSQMGVENSGEPSEMLLERIVSSYVNAILLVNYGGQPMEQSKHNVVRPGKSKSKDLNPAQQDTADISKKRKSTSTWREQVEMNSEGFPDDGYSWRKYGQKDILGAKHPRSYYRCTYSSIKGCCAKKQVQRNDVNPSLFDLTYKGKHTCTIVPAQKQQNFQTGLGVETHNLESQETEYGSQNHTFTQSTLDHSNFFTNFPPYNSASNYFSTSPGSSGYDVQYGQHCESEIIGMDYQLQQLELNPTYHYDNQVFYSTFYQPEE